MMQYRIEHKDAFTVAGYKKQFCTDTSYQEIPLWWDEFLSREAAVMGQFGVCIDTDGKLFDYLIADLHQPGSEVPPGCVTHTFPAGTWAVFPCTLDTLQETNTSMWRDWLPASKEYKLGGGYNLEYYRCMAPDAPSGDAVELWLPIAPK